MTSFNAAFVGLARGLREPAPRRMALPVLAVLAASVGTALAGDRAMIDFVGYSQDMRYFAYEEYGVSDGVGLAYSTITIVDLINDEVAAGSPFKTEADAATDEPLTEVRAKTHDAAKRVLDGMKIDVPVEILALSGDGVIGPANKLRFGIPAYGEPGATQGDYTLKLDDFEMPRSETCDAAIDRPGHGFALAITGDGKPRELHRDTDPLPEERGCPVGHRLYAVVTPFEFGSINNGVVIVGAYPFDFEGSSRRFVVVPISYGPQ